MSRWKGLSGVMAVVVALGLCVGLAMAQQQRGEEWAVADSIPRSGGSGWPSE